MPKKISFQEAYAQATNEAIKILGDVVSKIVTEYLERKYSIHLTKTPNNQPVGVGRIIRACNRRGQNDC